MVTVSNIDTHVPTCRFAGSRPLGQYQLFHNTSCFNCIIETHQTEAYNLCIIETYQTKAYNLARLMLERLVLG